MVFKNILIVLHPFAPFVTEYIYRDMYKTQPSIMLETWPNIIRVKSQPHNQKLMDVFNNVYDFARELRIKRSIKQATIIKINLITNGSIELEQLNEILKPFNVVVNTVSKERVDSNSTITTSGSTVIEYTDTFTNTSSQIKLLESEIQKLQLELERSKNILSNKQFLAKAPKDKVQEEQAKLQTYEEQYQKKQLIYKNLLSKK
jgi:valyl-tRNA synthetase